jgi:hypothetical protein
VCFKYQKSGYSAIVVVHAHQLKLLDKVPAHQVESAQYVWWGTMFADLRQVAPAMNTLMWESEFTSRQLAVLVELGVRVVPPVTKRLACGDVGVGAMAAPADIARVSGAGSLASQR